MLVNLNRNFQDLAGVTLKENVIVRDENGDAVKDEKGANETKLVPVTLNKIAGNALLHPVPDDDEQTIMAKYLLAKECYAAEEVELLAEEISLIKKCIVLAYPSNVVRGQALAMLEGK